VHLPLDGFNEHNELEGYDLSCSPPHLASRLSGGNKTEVEVSLRKQDAMVSIFEDENSF
jgi:hypothetical protein